MKKRRALSLHSNSLSAALLVLAAALPVGALIMLAVILRSGHAESCILAALVLLLATALLFCMLILQKRLYQYEYLLARLRDDNPEDPIWKLITPPYVNSFLQNIDYIFSRINDSNVEKYRVELLNRQAEFTALQSQINPHFLYNAFDSIRGQALVSGVPDIADMTEALSSFFRYSISRKGDFVTLEEELANIQYYFYIQQYRFGERFRHTVLCDDAEALRCMIPKLTLQPIVENAIYHGLETKVGNGQIIIRAELTRKKLLISVTDDGTGMSADKLESVRQHIQGKGPFPEITGSKAGGIALKNVNERIKLFYGEEYGVTIMSSLSLGTSVELVLPRFGTADELQNDCLKREPL